MKKTIVIIEDNFYKYFAAKNLLEGRLRLPVKTLGLERYNDIVEYEKSLNPRMMLFKKNGSAVELMTMLEKQGYNRRNAEIVFLLAEEFTLEECYMVQEFVSSLSKKAASFARAA